MLQLPALGARKEAILSLTPACTWGAEIGADHGITAAHLVRSGTCQHMIVSDISAASLLKAERLFAFHGITDRAMFVVADGLGAIRRPADAIIIAGMGAQTILRILQTDTDRIGNAALILQANADTPLLRTWLAASGFAIEEERLVLDKGRYYVILRAATGPCAYTPKECYLGPCLLAREDPLWQGYLAWRHGCLQAMRGEDVRMQLQWIEEEMA